MDAEQAHALTRGTLDGRPQCRLDLALRNIGHAAANGYFQVYLFGRHRLTFVEVGALRLLGYRVEEKFEVWTISWLEGGRPRPAPGT